MESFMLHDGLGIIRRRNIMVENIFPPCPKCEGGFMVPFSRGQDIFELWKCTSCGYTINKR